MSNKTIFFLILLILSSCSSLKKISIDEIDKEQKNKKELASKLYSHNNKYDWMRINSQLSIKNTEEINLNAIIKIKKDSLIWASISAPFGIELFRVMINKDSAYYMNRIKKTYSINSINNIGGITNFNMIDIQNIIVGDISVNEKIIADSSNLSINSNKATYLIDPKILRVSSVIYKDEDKSIMINYNYLNSSGQHQSTPNHIHITGDINQEIILSNNRFTINKKQKVTFNIPKSYVKEDY